MKKLEKELVVKEIIKEHCSLGQCDECGFFNPNDDTDGMHFCHARDVHGLVPYDEKWHMGTAMLSSEVVPQIRECLDK